MVASYVDVDSEPAHCWCGRTQVCRPCIFHGGDLEGRISQLLRSIRLVDTHDGAALKEPAKLLAWWLSATSGADRSRPGQIWFGDLECKSTPVDLPDDCWTVEEMSALIGEALLGRWPW